MADFEWYLNRQGARGQKGEKGDTGEAVSIEVVSDTANEYVLKFVSASGETVTPNLRGTLIDTVEEGTYVRYNPDTQQVYTSDIEMASTTTTGAVRFTTEEELLDSDSGVVVSPSDMQDYLFSKLQQGKNITINKDETTGNITIIGADGGYTLPPATQSTLGGIKVGTNLSITADGTLSAEAGGVSDYTEITNKPQINSVELTGNKTLDDLDIQRKFNAVNPLNFNLATQGDLVNTSFDEEIRKFTPSQRSIKSNSGGIVSSLYVDKNKQSADTPDLIFPLSCAYFPFSQNIGFNSQLNYRGVMLGTRNPDGSFTPKFGIGDCLFANNKSTVVFGAPYLNPRKYTSGSGYIDTGVNNADRISTGNNGAVVANLTDSSRFSSDNYYRIAQLIKNETSKLYEFVFIGLLTTDYRSSAGLYSKVVPLSEENTAIIDACDTVCVLSNTDGWDKHSYGKVVDLTNIDLRDYVNATPEEKYQFFISLNVPTPAETVETNYLQISTATTSQLGVVKPDGTSITIDSNGTISAIGTTDYTQLSNKPKIGGVELTGNKTLVNIGAQAITDNTLTTTSKTIVGAINELVTRITALETLIDAGEVGGNA